jgi:hypothetical protein
VYIPILSIRISAAAKVVWVCATEGLYVLYQTSRNESFFEGPRAEKLRYRGAQDTYRIPLAESKDSGYVPPLNEIGKTAVPM